MKALIWELGKKIVESYEINFFFGYDQNKNLYSSYVTVTKTLYDFRSFSFSFWGKMITMIYNKIQCLWECVFPYLKNKSYITLKTNENFFFDLIMLCYNSWNLFFLSRWLHLHLKKTKMYFILFFYNIFFVLKKDDEFSEVIWNKRDYIVAGIQGDNGNQSLITF